MAGVSIKIKSAGLEWLEARLAAIADPGAWRSLPKSVAGQIESVRKKEAQRRIREVGPGPDNFFFGRFAGPCPEWSEAYAETRHGGQGPLFGEGDLDDSIQALFGGDEAEVGTNLLCGAIQQFGCEEAGGRVCRLGRTWGCRPGTRPIWTRSLTPGWRSRSSDGQRLKHTDLLG